MVGPPGSNPHKSYLQVVRTLVGVGFVPKRTSFVYLSSEFHDEQMKILASLVCVFFPQ